MKIALEKEVLNLPLPIFLAGYANRFKPSEEIHDDLYLNLFYLENERQHLASFSIDLLGIYFGYHEKLVKEIKKRINDDKLIVIISYVHSHSAPALGNLFGNKKDDINKEQLFDEIVNKAVILINRAKQNKEESDLEFGSKIALGVGANRRDKETKANTLLNVLTFNYHNKKAKIVNFNCHPTLLSEENYLVSKDFQGQCMEELMKDGYLPLFYQGACGDISTRFTRQAQNFEECHRLGKLLAEHVNSITLDTLNVNDFNYEEHEFYLKPKTFFNEEFYLNEIERYKDNLENSKDITVGEKRLLITALQGAEIEYKMSLHADEIPSKVRYGLLTFNLELAIVFLPFELFSKIQDTIINRSAYKHTMIVGYTYDCLGYLPDQDSFILGGYEVLSCNYDENASNVLIKEILTKLNK